MAIGDAVHREITELEDSRVFFAIATGHLCPDWRQFGVVDGRMTYGGTCENCNRTVSTLMDDSDPENECDQTRVDRIHDL
jgi:hypothetical protein